MPFFMFLFLDSAGGNRIEALQPNGQCCPLCPRPLAYTNSTALQKWLQYGTPWEARFMFVPTPAILLGQHHAACPWIPLAHTFSSLSYPTKASLAWYVQGPPGSHLLCSIHPTGVALAWHTPGHPCSCLLHLSCWGILGTV